MNSNLWLFLLAPFLVASLLLFIPKERFVLHRRITVITFVCLLLMGSIAVADGASWQQIYIQQEQPFIPILFQKYALRLSVTPERMSLCISMLFFLVTLVGGHPFHSRNKVKSFSISALFICGLMQACFLSEDILVSFFFATSTHFFFWILMTQMGTGRRSLIALRIFSIFLVVDSLAIGFYLAPTSIINFIPYPWAIALGGLLVSWLRLGIFPFHSIHRWATQSIGPSAALLFTICQFLIGVHFIPNEFFELSPTLAVRESFFYLVIFHIFWIGFLSLGEKRPMMMLTHGLLLLSGISLILTPNVKEAFTLTGPWPWMMGLLATFGLFTDEIHNLKNDTLAPFEHAQVGLLLRWKSLHVFTQSLIIVFSTCLLFFPFWVMWMPENNYFSNPQKASISPQELFIILGAFCFGTLSLCVALFQLWKRFNTEAPVERMILPQGAEAPVLWQWHAVGIWSLILVLFGFSLFHL